MGQSWIDLLFAHWQVSEEALREVVPPQLPIDTYEGAAYGIYFLSLDANSCAAVHAARRTYRLPYHRSRIRLDRDTDGIRYDLIRTSEDGPPAYFEGRYGSEGEELPIRDGSLERWLTERYCLYTLDEDERIQRGEIHHPPWPLRQGWAEIETNTMAMPFGIKLEGEPLLHFSPRQDVVIWPLRPA